MSEVFGVRSLLYWWGILTATAFIQEWLRQLAKFFKTPNTFTPDKIPFNMLTGLNGWIDGAGDYIRTTVKFDPTAVLFKVGSFTLPTYILAFIAAFILIGIAAALVWRAIRSEVWFDDFVALFVMYVVLRLIGHIVSVATGVGFVDWFREFVNNPFAAYLIIMALLFFITFFGEGFQSKRAFWRALIASSLLSLFMFPREVAVVFGYIFDALAFFGGSLLNEQNVAFAIVWGLIGMVLAWQRLATPERGGGGRGGVSPMDSDTTQVNVEVR